MRRLGPGGALVAAGVLMLLAAGCGRDTALPAAPPDRDRIVAGLEAIAAEAMREGPLVGLSIAVARDGNDVAAGAWGSADLAASVPATPATTFNFASVSKPFTALAVLTLVDAGRLSLDDRLSDVLPAFPRPDDGARITVRQLLNHTSGLNDYVAEDDERWRRTGEPLRPAFVLDWLAARPLDFDPGSAWAYSNSAFYLAGMVVERVTGQRFFDYLREAVTGPLGLESIGPCETQPVPPRTRGYTAAAGASPSESMMYIVGGVVADGGLCGTARDLALMPAALLGGELLSDESLTAFLAPTVLSNGVEVAYGLGIRQGTTAGHGVWGHTGSSGTYVAKLARYEDDAISIAVLTNTLDAETDPVAIEGRVADLVLDLPARAPEAAAALTADAAAPYVGVYTTGRSANTAPEFEVSFDRGTLTRHGTANGTVRSTALVPLGNHVFGRNDWPRDRYVFHVIDGRAVAFSEFYNGMLASYNRRAERPR